MLLVVSKAHRRIPASEARRQFSDILDWAEHKGETTILTRHGKGVAAVGPWIEALPNQGRRNQPSTSKRTQQQRRA
jgi:prevent-host-death family protein